MAKSEKLLPLITKDYQEFWEGCRKHELRIQRCKSCAAFRHYPRPMCPRCNSTDYEWVRVSGKGKLYTWTTVHYPAHPAFADVPYVVAIVELAEGVRMVTNLIDCPLEDLYIGMPVEVVFEDVGEDMALPKFRPAAGHSEERR
jgi:hypothetical protein